MYKLGDRLRDIVTGFEGIAVGRAEYLNGCVQYCLKPSELRDGKMIEGEFIDESQLKLVESKVVVVGTRKTGGPQADTPQEKSQCI